MPIGDICREMDEIFAALHNCFVPERDWKWFGNPAHLAVRQNCHFHLATLVGKYVVSTVGEYIPDGETEYKRIALDALFETLVFRHNGDFCGCGCGLPDIEAAEIDGQKANTAKDANVNHAAMCSKYAMESQE